MHATIAVPARPPFPLLLQTSGRCRGAQRRSSRCTQPWGCAGVLALGWIGLDWAGLCCIWHLARPLHTPVADALVAQLVLHMATAAFTAHTTKHTAHCTQLRGHILHLCLKCGCAGAFVR